MPDASHIPSQRQFSNDLRRIREDRGLSLDALHDETKIPVGVLQEFEETGLFENPMFNRVYLRSLVRAYAAFLGIPTKTALQGLDEALLSTYQGRLAAEFLGTTPPRGETDGAPEADSTETISEAPPAETLQPEAAPPDQEDHIEEEDTPVVDEEEIAEGEIAAQAGDGRHAAEETMAPAGQVQEGEGDALHEYVGGAGAAREETPPAPPIISTAEPDWKRGKTPGARRVRPVDTRRRASNTQWGLIVGAVIIFTVAIWAVLAFLDRPNDGALQDGVVPDTLAADTTTMQVDTPPLRPPLTVGDTLDVVVLAVQKVERIHIKRDTDARRPYWIEEGVAKAYPALEQIILQDRLDRIRLIVEGFAHPVDQVDEAGRLVITRASAQRFLDTLTADPVHLSVVPDTIPMGFIRSQ